MLWDAHDLVAQCLKPQTREILVYLVDGHSLTSLEAVDRFGYARLAARVEELRGVGYAVQTQLVQEGGKRFARYRLV